MARVFDFDYKSCSLQVFQSRFNKLIKYCEKNKLPIHKWQILNYYCLNFRNWRKQLAEDDVVEWQDKIEYMDYKIQEAHIKLINIVIASDNAVAIAKIIEKEQDNLFEAQDNNSLALNNITIQLPEPTKRELPVKVVEIDVK